MGKIRPLQSKLPYLFDKARNLELAGTPRNNKRPSCREEELLSAQPLISALHQTSPSAAPAPPPPSKKKNGSGKEECLFGCYFFAALSASLKTDP